MCNQQHNAYKSFSDNYDIVVIYENLEKLITEAREDKDKTKKNLETSLDVFVKLLSSLGGGIADDAKKSLQAFYMLTIKRISKILYCGQDGVYDPLIQDIQLIKNTWREFT